MGLRDYTSKEVLNKVLYNNTALRAYSLSEGLNTILDAGNNRLKVRLEGGTVAGDLIVTGTLEVQGATTIIKSETIQVTDKTFELAVPSSGSPSDATSDGGGIILKGSTDKTILWNNANDWWNFNQGINVTGNAVVSGTVTSTFIGNVTGNVSGTAPAGTLTGSTLASGVTASSLTSVGTLTSLTVSGAPFVISNTNNGNNIDIKTTSSGSLVHAVKIHSGGLFEAKQGVSSTTGTFTGTVTAPSFTANSGTPALLMTETDTNPDSECRIVNGGGNLYIDGDLNAEIDDSFISFRLDNGQEKMRIDSSGNVGIGKTPTKKLSVEIGSTDDGGIDLSHSSGTVFARIGCVNPGVDNNTSMGSVSNNGLNILTNNLTRMHITSAGKVGIGDDAPPAMLSIKTAAQSKIVLENSGDALSDGDLLGEIQFVGNDATSNANGTRASISGITQNGSGGAYLAFSTANSSASNAEAMRIIADGKVGIGCTPAFSLDVQSTGDVIAWRTSAGLLGKLGYNGSDTDNGQIVVNDAGSEKIRLLANGASYINGGNVGIGSVAPECPFHVLALGNDGAGLVRVQSSSSSGNPEGIFVYYPSNSSTSGWAFYNANSSEGKSMITNAGGYESRTNSYGGWSDERIKTNIVDANSQWDDIKNIRLRNFKYKSTVAEHGDDAPTFLGVVAQEVESISPSLVEEIIPSKYEIEECGFGEQNEDGEWVVKKDENGKDMAVKTMKYSILYMKAIKALQEAMAKIETLEAKVKVLENG